MAFRVRSLDASTAGLEAGSAWENLRAEKRTYQMLFPSEDTYFIKSEHS